MLPGLQAGGKPWDTVKPLGRWFHRLDRLLLFDDDLHKSLPAERGNLVLVPGWDEADAGCPVLGELARALEEVRAPGFGAALAHKPGSERHLRGSSASSGACLGCLLALPSRPIQATTRSTSHVAGSPDPLQSA